MARRGTTLVHRGELTAGATDHGALTGLADDDHTQYHTDARALTWLGSQNVSVLTNDAGYLTTVAGTAITTFDGTAYRLLLVNSTGDVTELAHGSSGHVLTSNGASADPSWQAASGGSSLTNFQDNGSVGEILYSTDVVARSTASGLSIHDTSGGVEQPILTLRDRADTTTYGGFGYLPSNNGVWLYSEVVSGHLNLLGYNASSSFVNLAVLDPDAGASLYYDGTASLATSSTGINVTGTTGDGEIELYSNSGNRAEFITNNTNGQLTIRPRTNSANVSFVSPDSTGTLQTLFIGDPDNTVDLYYNGDLVFATRSQGIDVNAPSTNPQIRFNSSTSTLRGIVYYNDTDNQMVMDARETANSGIRLDHTGSSTLQTALDSDGTQLNLYYDGTQVANTTTQGMQFTTVGAATACVVELAADNNQASAINFEETTSTRFQVGYFGSSGLAHLRVVNSGEDINILNLADGTMASFKGGGGAELYYNGTKEFETISGSVKFGTHTAIGSETVTGYITIQDSGGTSRKIAVVS